MKRGGGGTTTLDQFSYTGSFSWKDDEHTLLALTSSGVLSFPGQITLQVFMVGGGGGGGNGGAGTYSGPGGGGGGGYTQTSQVTLNANEEYAVVIGAGGASDVDGGSTSAFDLSVNGGSKGGNGMYSAANNPTKSDGGDGGSGGGGGGTGMTDSTSASDLRGGKGGSDGSSGSRSPSENPQPGGTGQSITTRAFGDPDGELYAGGGGGGGGHNHYDGKSYRGLGGAGGAGGGGSGGAPSTNRGDTYIAPTNGTSGYGGGGGGAPQGTSYDGAAGGSGVILLRVPPTTQSA